MIDFVNCSGATLHLHVTPIAGAGESGFDLVPNGATRKFCHAMRVVVLPAERWREMLATEPSIVRGRLQEDGQ